jgi:hypothetical protein
VYRLLERRADAGQGHLSRVGPLLYMRDCDFGQAMQQLWRTLMAFSPDIQFKQALRREGYWYVWAGLKYFLYEYEEQLAAKKSAVPKISWEEVRRRERADTIEHVLPQTPRDPYWRERFDKTQRKTLTHTISGTLP